MHSQVLVSVIRRSMQAVISDKKGWECALSRILVAKMLAFWPTPPHPTPRQCCSQVRRKVHAFENFLNTCPRSWLLKMKRIVYDISVKERFVWSKATLGFLEEAFWDVTQGKEAKSYWAVARWWDKVPFRFGWICWSLFSPLGFKFGWALVLPNNSKNLFIWEHMKIIPVDIRRKWCDQ